MKKQILVLIILIFTVSSSTAQTDSEDVNYNSSKMSFGLKAGINSVQNKIVTNTSDNVQKKSGVYLGAFVNIPTSETFSIQPELIYSSTEYQGNNNMNLLHIPVLLTFEFAEKFNGFLGPEWQVLLNLDNVENEDLFNSFMFGFTFGANYQITPNFLIEARPYFAISKFIEEDSGYRKFNTLQIGLAYKF